MRSPSPVRPPSSMLASAISALSVRVST
jgi:hypothetical protein